MVDRKDPLDLTGMAYSEIVPSLLKSVDARSVAGFDTSATPRANPDVPEASNNVIQVNELDMSQTIFVQKLETHHNRSISISLPSSPSALFIEKAKGDQESDICRLGNTEAQTTHFANGRSSGFVPPKHYSQPMPLLKPNDIPERKPFESKEHQQQVPRRVNRLKDKRYDSFKTWSGKLERQISTLRGKPQEKREITEAETTEPTKSLPAVDRYFDALEGPELDKLRASEELVLPEDKKWPFLLRYPMSSFGICLGVSSQAMLWKALATSPSMSFLHISLKVNFILWCISLALMVAVSAIYALKVVFYFEAVRREYYHPIRVNFFFAPWITCLFLAIGVPPIVAVNIHASVWYVLMIPILILEVKIYGQWMSGGQRRLSKVANPSNHLSIVGNFVGALLGASMGLKEGPIFFFGVGLAHYIVLFVTLYQRLPTNETLPKDLHPVFFLFVAAPSVASMAWAKITGEFSYGSKIAFFISLFLYASLAVRLNFFRGFRFSLAWWAYTFPMTGAAVATIRYSAAVQNVFTQCLSVALSVIASLTVTALLITTIIYAFVLHDLFPNDITIAISNTKQKPSKMNLHILKPNVENKDIEAQKTLEGH